MLRTIVVLFCAAALLSCRPTSGSLLMAASACQPETRVSPPAATVCSVSTPEGAPARFVLCREGGREKLVAIITPGSHCVRSAPVDAQLSCEDGTQVSLRTQEAQASCALRRDARLAYPEASCTLEKVESL